MAEPILKWAGGKRQIIDQILSFFPRDFKTRRYHEPMIGAGAIVFATEPRSGTINDINSRLMRMYEVARDYPEELILLNGQHKYSKKYYKAARERFNLSLTGGQLDKVVEASLMIYLNRTCWNGLYRENRSGFFNVPIGDYHKPDYVVAERIRKASSVLKRVRIFQEDFDYVLDEAKKGDIVYFDPPYHPDSSASTFTAYHREGFDFEQQKRLKEAMSKLSENGVYVILSNSDVPKLRELYSGLKDSFRVERIRARRNINCKGDGRGKVGELIVSNVPSKERNVVF